MKLTSSVKFKLWITITLALIVAGMTILGIFGFNQTVDYTDSYELQVKVEKNLGDANTIMTEEVDKYFAEKGIKDAAYSRQSQADGEKLIYKFTANNSLFNDANNLDVVKSELEAKIEKAFAERGSEQIKNSNLQVEVNAYSATHYVNQNVWKFVLAIGIALVVMLIYVMIMEKVAGGLAVFFNSIIAGVLAISLSALARIPADPYLFATIATASLLSAVLSMVIVNRARELGKNVANEKLTAKELAEKATKASGVRVLFMAGAMLVASLLLIILGTGVLKLIGLHLLVAGVSSVFTAYGFTEIFYGALKTNK